MSLPRSLIFAMAEPLGIDVPFAGARLARGLQLVSPPPPADVSGPATCAGCGDPALPTGAGSTGFPGLPQDAASSVTSASTPARTVFPRLLTGTPSVAPGSPW
jgi:hypothetical protein